jgi:hypothetical protein
LQDAVLPFQEAVPVDVSIDPYVVEDAEASFDCLFVGVVSVEGGQVGVVRMGRRGSLEGGGCERGPIVLGATGVPAAL